MRHVQSYLQFCHQSTGMAAANGTQLPRPRLSAKQTLLNQKLQRSSDEHNAGWVSKIGRIGTHSLTSARVFFQPPRISQSQGIIRISATATKNFKDSHILDRVSLLIAPNPKFRTNFRTGWFDDGNLLPVELGHNQQRRSQGTLSKESELKSIRSYGNWAMGCEACSNLIRHTDTSPLATTF